MKDKITDLRTDTFMIYENSLVVFFKLYYHTVTTAFTVIYLEIYKVFSYLKCEHKLFQCTFAQIFIIIFI